MSFQQFGDLDLHNSGQVLFCYPNRFGLRSRQSAVIGFFRGYNFWGFFDRFSFFDFTNLCVELFLGRLFSVGERFEKLIAKEIFLGLFWFGIRLTLNFSHHFQKLNLRQILFGFGAGF